MEDKHSITPPIAIDTSV